LALIDEQRHSAIPKSETGNVIKALVEISRTAPPEKADPEEIRRRARRILETEYGIKRG